MRFICLYRLSITLVRCKPFQPPIQKKHIVISALMTYLLYVCICYILPACHLAPTSAGFDKEFPRSCVLQLTFRHQASQSAIQPPPPTTQPGLVWLTVVCHIYAKYTICNCHKPRESAEPKEEVTWATKPECQIEPTIQQQQNKQTMRTNLVSPLNSASPPITLFARVCEHKGVKRIDNV